MGICVLKVEDVSSSLPSHDIDDELARTSIRRGGINDAEISSTRNVTKNDFDCDTLAPSVIKHRPNYLVHQK